MKTRSSAVTVIVGLVASCGSQSNSVPREIDTVVPARVFPQHESDPGFPASVYVNQQRPQEETLLARVLLEPNHVFEIYKPKEDSIFYAEAAAVGIAPFPLTAKEKRELSPKSIFKRVAPNTPIPASIEKAELQFKEAAAQGLCTKHSDDSISCPQNTTPPPDGGSGQSYDGGAPLTDAGIPSGGGVQSGGAAAASAYQFESETAGRALIRPVVKDTNGVYTGCPWDWFRTTTSGEGVPFCPNPGWNGVDFTGCLEGYVWAYAYGNSKYETGTVCTISGSVDFDYYVDNQIIAAFYVPESSWQNTWRGPRWGCTLHWYCGYIVLCDCGDRYEPVEFNIPTIPNGPYGVFQFGWGIDTQ